MKENMSKEVFISKVLYQLDPMGTGCVENAQSDEYNTEADQIVSMVRAGFSVFYSVKTVFEVMFWDDCLSNESLNTICEHLNNF